jgi:hypothetical protein
LVFCFGGSVRAESGGFCCIIVIHIVTPARSTYRYSRVIFRHSPTENVWLSLSATVDVAADVTVAAAAADATALPPTTPPPQLIPARILRCKRGEWAARGRHLETIAIAIESMLRQAIVTKLPRYAGRF